MAKTGLVLMLSAIALVGVGCAKQEAHSNQNSQTAAASPPSDPFAAAKTHYNGKCVACHGPTGHGGQVTIEGVTLKVPSLVEGHALNHTDEQMVKQILNGGEGMPAFKDKLNAQEAGELVRYIRKEVQKK
jgi:mono/diheme cytochrome c family protein